VPHPALPDATPRRVRRHEGNPLRFDASYEEVVVLRDGSRVRLRTVRPQDKAHLVRGLHRLSEGSRRARFLAAKNRLTEAELAYLTEVDGIDHFAIGALAIDADGEEGEGVGVGRFVRMLDDPCVAEPAIVVVDAWQNRGLGRLLLDRLIQAALERRIDTFHAEFLAENDAIRRLLESFSPEMLMQRRAGVVVATMPLRAPDGEAGEAEAGEHLRKLLRLAAKRLLKLRPPS
jgi:GNAT superfamily N-acetyltransferase